MFVRVGHAPGRLDTFGPSVGTIDKFVLFLTTKLVNAILNFVLLAFRFLSSLTMTSTEGVGVSRWA